MGVAAILVMWHGFRDQTWNAATQGGSTKNFNLIGQVVSEKKIVDDDEDGSWPSYQLSLWAFGWGELKKKKTRRFLVLLSFIYLKITLC